MAWGFVPLFLWVVIWKFDRKVLRRVDVVPWLLIFVITAAGLTVLAVTSWDVIKAELNSVYPGNAPSSSRRYRSLVDDEIPYFAGQQI